jgi:large subunit ribosomal protein L23
MKILIKKPVISEKSVSQGGVNKYTFLVDKTANKKTVADAVSQLFKVKVEDVNIVNIPGKLKRFRRTVARRSDRKKAIVTVKKGEHINLFEEKK